MARRRTGQKVARSRGTINAAIWPRRLGNSIVEYMINNDSFRVLRQVLAAIAGMSMLVSTALAEDGSASSHNGALPGVTSDYRIAKPAPVAEPDDAVPSNGIGQFKIGDTDVRISGSITIDAGAGAIKPSGH